MGGAFRGCSLRDQFSHIRCVPIVGSWCTFYSIRKSPLCNHVTLLASSFTAFVLSSSASFFFCLLFIIIYFFRGWGRRREGGGMTVSSFFWLAPMIWLKIKSDDLWSIVPSVSLIRPSVTRSTLTSNESMNQWILHDFSWLQVEADRQLRKDGRWRLLRLAFMKPFGLRWIAFFFFFF